MMAAGLPSWQFSTRMKRRRDTSEPVDRDVAGTGGVRLVTTREGAVRIEVHAVPRARASGIDGVRDGALLVRLAAPPVDGEANVELVRTLSALLDVAKRDVSVVRGASARRKLVEIRGAPATEIAQRLEKTLR